jgi:hypothetical protein
MKYIDVLNLVESIVKKQLNEDAPSSFEYTNIAKQMRKQLPFMLIYTYDADDFVGGMDSRSKLPFLKFSILSDRANFVKLEYKDKDTYDLTILKGISIIHKVKDINSKEIYPTIKRHA